MVRSSAYRCFQGRPIRDSRKRACVTIAKNSRLKTKPWYTPTVTSNHSLRQPFSLNFDSSLIIRFPLSSQTLFCSYIFICIFDCLSHFKNLISVIVCIYVLKIFRLSLPFSIIHSVAYSFSANWYFPCFLLVSTASVYVVFLTTLNASLPPPSFVVTY